jgi:hypothetical protein
MKAEKSAEKQEFENKYMLGYCDAMAMALSSYADLPIRAMYPVHVLADGSERVDPDFLHVYVMDGDQAWDAKGKRSEKEIAEDFSDFMSLLKRPGDVEIKITTEDYNDADDLIESKGCDTSNVAEALQDAVEHLGIDQQTADMTARLFKKSERHRLC